MPELNTPHCRVLHRVGVEIAFRTFTFSMLLLVAPASVICQTLPSWLNDEVKQLTPSLVSSYKQIHQHPELGKAEVQTASLVRDALRRIGFSDFVMEPNLPTAVIAVLDSGRAGTTIVLRAELDARPGKENVDVEYKSADPEKMHSCGHDAHTAMLMATAEILYKHRKELRGKYVFLFQPAEETLGGADDIVNDRILEKLGADIMFAQHVAPGLAVGTMQVSPGPIMASSTYFAVRVQGAGSHAATPESGSDVVRLAAEMVSAFSSFPARHFSVLNEPVVVSVTHFEAGDTKALNKIPNEATFEGTIRTFAAMDSPQGKSMLQKLDEFLSKTAAANGASATVTYRTGSPVAINDPSLFKRLAPILARTWDGKFETEGERSMYSEDFAYYSRILPCLYFGLGVSGGKRGMHDVHTDEFDLSLEALPVGTRFLLILALVSQRS